MEAAGPLGTPLGLAQRKRASPRGEAGTSGFPCVSDSDRSMDFSMPGSPVLYHLPEFAQIMSTGQTLKGLWKPLAGAPDTLTPS